MSYDWGIWDLLCECWLVPPGLSRQVAKSLLDAAQAQAGGEAVLRQGGR